MLLSSYFFAYTTGTSLKSGRAKTNGKHLKASQIMKDLANHDSLSPLRLCIPYFESRENNVPRVNKIEGRRLNQYTQQTARCCCLSSSPPSVEVPS